ncbi:hypothetical protein N2602_07340 [Bradyrhizobium sp. NC92]|nr:hypothetical protein [Bradyrhizobium sp. NC92]UWU70339.1 hypothetical protein N2602_07340 [Bradyrhizobium sp. NC92]
MALLEGHLTKLGCIPMTRDSLGAFARKELTHDDHVVVEADIVREAMSDPVIRRLMTLPSVDMTVASGVAAARSNGTPRPTSFSLNKTLRLLRTSSLVLPPSGDWAENAKLVGCRLSAASARGQYVRVHAFEPRYRPALDPQLIDLGVNSWRNSLNSSK